MITSPVSLASVNSNCVFQSALFAGAAESRRMAISSPHNLIKCSARSFEPCCAPGPPASAVTPTVMPVVLDLLRKLL